MLLGQQAVLEDTQVEAIFNKVLFPFIDDLLKPQVFQLDPRGMPETRLRASALLCKVFMQYEVNDAAKQKDIRLLWIEVLDLLDRLMNADKRDQLVSPFPYSPLIFLPFLHITDHLFFFCVETIHFDSMKPSRNPSRT